MTAASGPASRGARPAPGATENLDRLRALLREMFQLDRGDLDFGLYRIMSLKSAEIGSFLDNDLLPQVKRKLRLTSDEERAGLEKDLEAAAEASRSLGADPDTNPLPKIVELRRRLAEMRKDADAEADVYNHLADFFGRYYAEGDFISQRRYSSGGRSAYLMPYDGEEVKLHWANADQYYVKTTENYASYVFTVGSGNAVSGSGSRSRRPTTRRTTSRRPTAGSAVSCSSAAGPRSKATAPIWPSASSTGR